MIRAPLLLVLGSAALLAGCVTPQPPVVASTPIPATDPLYRPERVEPGRLEYAPDRTTFAPVLTEKFPYPTQSEANDAYRRLKAQTGDHRGEDSIWLFGCKPGALDAETARVKRYPGPVVLCAVDFVDPSGRRAARRIANFYYRGWVWNMQLVDPPLAPVPWLTREPSPTDPWSWIPGRDRFQ